MEKKRFKYESYSVLYSAQEGVLPLEDWGFVSRKIMKSHLFIFLHLLVDLISKSSLCVIIESLKENS